MSKKEQEDGLMDDLDELLKDEPPISEREAKELRMEDLADEKTMESKKEAEATRREDWCKFFKENSRDICRFNENLDEPFFNGILNFLVMRTRQMQQGTYLELDYAAPYYLPVVMAFDFSYSYEVLQWNRSSMDLNGDPFDVEAMDSDYLKEQEWKREIVRQLEEFLLAGAAQAKRLGSDVYSEWRAALIELIYTQNRFVSGGALEDAQALWKKVAAVAQMTAIDCQVAAKMKLSTDIPPHKTRDKKNAKNKQKL